MTNLFCLRSLNVIFMAAAGRAVDGDGDGDGDGGRQAAWARWGTEARQCLVGLDGFCADRQRATGEGKQAAGCRREGGWVDCGQKAMEAALSRAVGASLSVAVMSSTRARSDGPAPPRGIVSPLRCSMAESAVTSHSLPATVSPAASGRLPLPDVRRFQLQAGTQAARRPGQVGTAAQLRRPACFVVLVAPAKQRVPEMKGPVAAAPLDRRARPSRPPSSVAAAPACYWPLFPARCLCWACSCSPSRAASLALHSAPPAASTTATLQRYTPSSDHVRELISPPRPLHHSHSIPLPASASLVVQPATLNACVPASTMLARVTPCRASCRPTRVTGFPVHKTNGTISPLLC